MVCFVHFDFEMCFAPQRRALFRHLNFQKWSERGVFCTFWLTNVLRATTACSFSSLIWPAGSAPAALASLLFDPPGAPNHRKNHSVSRLSYLFSHLHLLSSYSFSSTLLSSNLSLLSASSLLCFSSVHIVGSLTSKLPSIIYLYIPWPSEPAKFVGWHLKPRVSKQNPGFFYFHKFQDHAPKCSDFINAVGPQKVLHFCPVYWSSTPKHKPKHNNTYYIILYFHQFQGVPTHVLYHGCTRVNHGLNMGWTRVRENLVIFKIHEVKKFSLQTLGIP